MTEQNMTEGEAVDSAASAMTPPPIPQQVMYFALKDGQQEGPYAEAALHAAVNEGRLQKDSLVWTAGMPEWKSYKEVMAAKSTPLDVKAVAVHSAHKAKESIIKAVTKVDLAVGKTSGLGKLEGFAWGKFFSAVFKKHPDEEVYEIFNCGTPTSTPTLSEISVNWPTPWLFTRMLVYGLALSVLFYIGFTHFENVNMIPGFIFFSSMAIPFSVFIMFYELNVRRDVSMYNAIRALFGGGTAALLYTLLMHSKIDFINLQADWMPILAGPIEEMAKLYAALFVAKFVAMKNGRILTGVLMGCATGAGFAIFETAGYIFNFLYVGGLSAMREVAVMRGLLSPLCHVVWTAVTVGGFYMVSNLREKENAAKLEWKGLDWRTVADSRFYRIALIPVVLHMIWNSNHFWGVLFGHASVGIYTVFAILGFVAWAVALRLVQAGIYQVRKEKEEAEIESAAAAETAEQPEEATA